MATASNGSGLSQGNMCLRKMGLALSSCLFRICMRRIYRLRSKQDNDPARFQSVSIRSFRTAKVMLEALLELRQDLMQHGVGA